MNEALPILTVFASLPRSADGRAVLRAADPLAAHLAMREQALLVQHSERRFVRLRGPGAEEYLQRLTSADVIGLAPGQGSLNCVLSGKGKLIAHFLLWRLELESFLLEVGVEAAEALYSFLDQFHFAEPFDLDRPDLLCVGRIGPAVGTWEDWQLLAAGDGYLLRSDELGQPSERFVGPLAAAEAWAAGQSGDPLGGSQEIECLRIEAGWPRAGFDAEERSVPLELGLDSACSTTKGCYPGQEMIARIYRHGHVNRSLVRVRIEGGELPERGAGIFDEGMQAGRLTSVCEVPGSDFALGLAMLPLAAIEDAEDLRVGGEDGSLLKLLGVVKL